jgi:integrase
MAGRSRRGRGTVFHDDDRGRWVGQISYFDDAGKRRRPKVYGSTETECWDKLDELRAELKKTGSVSPRGLTVAGVVDDLMAHPPAEWKSPSTLQGKRDHAERIKSRLGTIKLARLTVAQVERYLEWMAAGGYSADSMRRARSLLRLAIRRAQKDERISRNVAELADVPAGSRRQSRSMTLPQIRALLGLRLTAWWRAYLTCALMCGLRPGELLGLRWEDVDFTAGVIRVRKCLKALPDPQTGKRRLVLEDLKTEQSKRTIRMPRHVVTALQALRREQAAARLKLGALYDTRARHRVRGRRRRAEVAARRPQVLRHAVRPGGYRGELDTSRAAAHVRISAVGFRCGYREDRRRGRPHQLDDHEDRLPASDRRRGDRRGNRDGLDFRGGERLVNATGSPDRLPVPSRNALYLAPGAHSVTPCAGNGSPRVARRSP